MFRLDRTQRFIVGLIFVMLPVLCVSAPASAYARATVVNHTTVAISGTVHLCSVPVRSLYDSGRP